MKIDGQIRGDLTTAGASARELEDRGYDGGWTMEGPHDPFLPLAVAAAATERIDLGTNIAVAFARSPMNVAVIANDLQAASRGRLILGLGSQVRTHIEKRFSMTWSHPAPRMREFVLALRAIWSCFNEGTGLEFRGEFYTHTVMTPFFRPAPHAYGPPRVYLAGVGARMTEVAGEVADGLLVHPFTTEKYLREATLPAIERGLARAGRDRGRFRLQLAAMTSNGDDAGNDAVRRQLAFYGSTPAYRPVLDAHGWGDIQPELNRLSKVGEWETMAKLITDEMVETFAVVATPEELPARLAERYGGLIDRIAFYYPEQADTGAFAPLRAA